MSFKNLTVIKHPLVQHKLSLMRDKRTPSALFRDYLRGISLLLAYEVLRDLPVKYQEIETPLAPMKAPMVDGNRIALISILRAGNGLLDGILEIIPDARVGHVGIYRDHKTLKAVEYYFKVPTPLDECDLIVVDPMLATGNSAIAAMARLKQLKPKSIKFVCLLAAPEGIQALQKEHPDVPIFTAAIDECLNQQGYILPGLGDAGDRLYGTR
ncbi:MAG: uracil phosphoribosyltransferase [Deltaproteobacteria bacterium]|nr:uracil phosphoribosyltransferase [Deltaproteobacteria bacterium]